MNVKRVGFGVIPPAAASWAEKSLRKDKRASENITWTVTMGDGTWEMDFKAFAQTAVISKTSFVVAAGRGRCSIARTVAKVTQLDLTKKMSALSANVARKYSETASLQDY